MITEALLQFAGTVIRSVLGLIPTWEPATDPFSETGASVGAMAAVGNGYFPVSVLVGCLAVVLGLKIALLVWRAVLFVYELIPFKMS